jgi:hypothetical protein
MKTSILLSSAALLIAGSAFAADLPAKKAAPAAAPTGCAAFGAGFIAIPGGDSCLKISGFVRSDNKYTANTDRGKAPYAFNYKFIIDFDVRNNTELGTLRSQLGLVAWNTVTGKSGTGTAVAGDTVQTESAFVELGGFRAGAAPSPVDFDNAYNNSGVSYQPTYTGQLIYTTSFGSTSVTVGAQAAENNNDQGLTPATVVGEPTNVVQASRPDLLIAATSKVSDSVTLKGGLVSHEVVGSSTGTAQGFAALGRADISFAPVKLVLGGAYENGANAYVDNNGNGLVNGYFNSTMGGKIKDSASDASNLSTGYNYAAALEYALGTNVLYAYADTEHGQQDTATYKRTDVGVGFKYFPAKGIYIRPEIYQKVENANAASDTISNVFYLRIRRDF